MEAQIPQQCLPVKSSAVTSHYLDRTRKAIVVTDNLLCALGSEFVEFLSIIIQEDGSDKVVGEAKPNGVSELGIG